MDNDQIMMKEKLDFWGIIKQALTIPLKNHNFILVFLLTSFSLFFFLVLYELIFLQSLIITVKHGLQSTFSLGKIMENVSQIHLLSSLLLFGIIHLLDLVNTIITVYTAAVAYAGGEANFPLHLKQILSAPIKKVGFKGPLITSICALVLSSLTSIGLSIFAIGFTTDEPLLISIIGVPFLALLIKHIEWSAVWNMGLVMSILEEKHGDVAIGISWYLSRGCRKRGFLLAFVFFAWKFALRLSCLHYVAWHGGGIANLVQVIGGKVCLDCAGNFIMWVCFVVYFYDCKRRLLEKKFDGAEGRVALNARV